MKNVLIAAILDLKPYAEAFGFEYPCVTLGARDEADELSFYNPDELAAFLVEMAQFIEAAVREECEAAAAAGVTY